MNEQRGSMYLAGMFALKNEQIGISYQCDRII